MINNTLSFKTANSTTSSLSKPKGTLVATKPPTQNPSYSFSVTNTAPTAGILQPPKTTTSPTPASSPLAAPARAPLATTGSAGLIAPGITSFGLTPEQQDGIKKAHSLSTAPVTPAPGEITPASVRGLFPDIASSLARGSVSQNEELAARAARIAETAGKEFADIGKLGAAAEGGYRTTGTTPVAEGNAAVIAQTRAAQQEAVAKGAEMALGGVEKGLTAQGQAQSGLAAAGGLAKPSAEFPFVFDPTTGQYKTTAGGAVLDPNVAAANYAREVATGVRSYDDAVAALGLYGASGKQILDSAIRQVNPNFNFAQAQTLSGLQGQVRPAYDYANTALSNVENILTQLGSLQGTNVPIANEIGKRFSQITGVGSGPVREYIGAVQTLRNAYASLLASAKGGTPTDYSSQANAEIPDWPTPNDLDAIRKNFETLGQARVELYGVPGAGGASAAPGGGTGAVSGWDW